MIHLRVRYWMRKLIMGLCGVNAFSLTDSAHAWMYIIMKMIRVTRKLKKWQADIIEY